MLLAPKRDDSEHRLVMAHRVAIHVDRILLGAPEILVGFIGLRLSPLLLYGGEPFSLLISHAGRFDSFAADEEHSASHQANELKMLHIGLYNELGRRRLLKLSM
jgi:hypothetical protein